VVVNNDDYFSPFPAPLVDRKKASAGKKKQERRKGQAGKAIRGPYVSAWHGPPKS